MADAKTKKSSLKNRLPEEMADVARDAANPAKGFTTVRALTLPSFDLKLGVPTILNILDAMRVSTVVKKPGPNGVQEKPADIVTAVDASTGEKGILMVPAVLKSTWEKEYTGDAYVGKYFQLTKLPKPEGKRYHAWTVLEVKPE